MEHHANHRHEHHAAALSPAPSVGMPRAHDHTAMVADFRRRFWISLVLTLPLLILAPDIQGFFGLALSPPPWSGAFVFVLASAVYFYGGWPFLSGAFAEGRSRRPGMMTLIALAITVAYGYSSAVIFGLPGHMLFWELATLVDIMLLGHWLEMRSVLGASSALEKLVTLLPANAHRLRPDGSVEEAPLSALQPQDRVLIRPGEKIPTDGVIVEGSTTVNESMLTGESRPVEKREAKAVIGGSINGESTIIVEVRKIGSETYLSQVIALVQQAQASRSRTQDLADRAALALTIIAVGFGTATLTIWLALQQSFEFAIARMVTVMVIACPHALGLAIPLVVAVSTTLSAQRGLLIRDRAAFERARRIDAVVFDKTGTLTQGRFGVTDVVPLGARSENDLLRLAASLERNSEHPIARGIVESAQSHNIMLSAPRQFHAIAGRGAEGFVEEHEIKVISPGYLQGEPRVTDDERIRALTTQGKTVVFVMVDGDVCGAIALADIIRAESRDAVAQLKNLGVQVMMLTGDSRAVANWVAHELALDDFFAEVLPHQKAEKIAEIKKRGLRVAMVGDGINDAPALVAADVGIAIGAGTDVAIESADIVLVRSDPRDVVAIIDLARRTYDKMVQNLWWATGYNIITIPLAAGILYKAGILLSPALGAIFMSASTIIVAINARLLRNPKSAR